MTDISLGMGKGILWGSIAATVTFLLAVPLMDQGPVTVEAGLIVPMFFGLLLIILFFLTLAALLIGLPAVTLLDRLGCAGADIGALSGALAGLTVTWAFTFLGGGDFGDGERMFTLAAIAGGGVLGGVWGQVLDGQRWDEDTACPADNPIPLSHRIDDPRLLR